MEQRYKVFIPGRLCILGEHSDWASEYQTQNPKIGSGYAIVAGLPLGITASGQRCEDFVYTYQKERIRLNCQEVLSYHEEGFFSYVIASAKQMIQTFHVKGLEVCCEAMNLPIKKGLASSAAICVAIVRLYNIVYGLQLSLEQEMKLAYLAELSTGVECGKMDQICAYGSGIRYICFYGEKMEVMSLKPKTKLSLILVDLKAEKNTKQILSDLNQAYPFPKNKKEEALHHFLGADNREYVKQAKQAVIQGNTEVLGKVMQQYQKQFDSTVSVCSNALKAPLLHDFIEQMKSRREVLACKGIGSQGDGMAEILLRDKNVCDTVIKWIKNQYQYDCYVIDL